MEDKLNTQLSTFLTEDQIREVRQLFQAAGYVKLPGNANNVTITTSDNPTDGKLLTRQEWQELEASERG